MAKMIGKYLHEKNENLDEYFKACGVPYIPRKMMMMTSPVLEISKNDNDEWTISSSTMLRTHTVTFKLGEEYEEHMPGGVLKCTTNLEDDKLITATSGPNDVKATRTYMFTENQCILAMKHEATGIEGKRYFNRSE